VARPVPRARRARRPKILEPTDAIIEMTTTGRCGSDLHLYDVLAPFMTEGDILGHEPMGIVLEVGSSAGDLHVGDGVVGVRQHHDDDAGIGTLPSWRRPHRSTCCARMSSTAHLRWTSWPRGKQRPLGGRWLHGIGAGVTGDELGAAGLVVTAPARRQGERSWSAEGPSSRSRGLDHSLAAHSAGRHKAQPSSRRPWPRSARGSRLSSMRAPRPSHPGPVPPSLAVARAHS
jgi:hypothetical protein